MYKCSVCNYTSNLKSNVIRHISKLQVCGEGNREIKEVLIEYSCEYCKKTLTTKRSLDRHLKTCKIKKIDLEKELIIKNDEVIELEKRLAVAEAINKILRKLRIN